MLYFTIVVFSEPIFLDPENKQTESFYEIGIEPTTIFMDFG